MPERKRVSPRTWEGREEGSPTYGRRLRNGGGGGGGRTSGSPVWAERSSSGSREPPKRCRGEVQVPVLDQETEAGPWGGVRRAACGAVSGQRCVYVPYSAREGPEPEWASQKGQRMATLSKQGRKVGRFWRGSAVPASPNTHLLRLSMRAWRAFTAGRSGRACGRGRIRLATGETPSGPGQYRASSLYCEGNISGGTGGRAGGARWAGGDEKSGSGELCFGGVRESVWQRVFLGANFWRKASSGPPHEDIWTSFPLGGQRGRWSRVRGGKGSPSSRGALGGGRGGEGG